MIGGNLDIKVFESLEDCGEELLDKIWLIFAEIFNAGEEDVARAKMRLEKQSVPQVIVAYFEGELAGFKIGYEIEYEHSFYSWLGAVDKKFRRRGIASSLMYKQHEVCRAKGYKYIKTNTYNRWREMLMMNLKNGFDIVGLRDNRRGEMKLMLEKEL